MRFAASPSRRRATGAERQLRRGRLAVQVEGVGVFVDGGVAVGRSDADGHELARCHGHVAHDRRLDGRLDRVADRRLVPPALLDRGAEQRRVIVDRGPGVGVLGEEPSETLGCGRFVVGVAAGRATPGVHRLMRVIQERTRPTVVVDQERNLGTERPSPRDEILELGGQLT